MPAKIIKKAAGAKKAGTRKGHNKPVVWKKMSEEEIRLMRMWFVEEVHIV